MASEDSDGGHVIDERAPAVWSRRSPDRRQPFLLIVRTVRVVTAEAVATDTRSFQHLAGCTARDHSRQGQRLGTSRLITTSDRPFNERAAINARLQGTAADIIRRAMTRVEEALAAKKLSAQMLLQVHDELIFEVPDDEVAATLPVVQHVMQDAPFPAVLLSVPLHVDARAANNWDEAH
jgi:hypothetical protein